MVHAGIWRVQSAECRAYGHVHVRSGKALILHLQRISDSINAFSFDPSNEPCSNSERPHNTTRQRNAIAKRYKRVERKLLFIHQIQCQNVTGIDSRWSASAPKQNARINRSFNVRISLTIFNRKNGVYNGT